MFLLLLLLLLLLLPLFMLLSLLMLVLALLLVLLVLVLFLVPWLFPLLRHFSLLWVPLPRRAVDTCRTPTGFALLFYCKCIAAPIQPCTLFCTILLPISP